MKFKIMGLLTLLAASNSWAVTNIDGIWSCQLQLKSTSSTPPIYQNYFSIHSHSDGQIIFATLKESNDWDYFGYGLGKITGSIYAGFNKYAMPFSLTLGTDNVLTGTMQGLDSLHHQQDLTAKCIKVW